MTTKTKTATVKSIRPTDRKAIRNADSGREAECFGIILKTCKSTKGATRADFIAAGMTDYDQPNYLVRKLCDEGYVTREGRPYVVTLTVKGENKTAATSAAKSVPSILAPAFAFDNANREQAGLNDKLKSLADLYRQGKVSVVADAGRSKVAKAAYAAKSKSKSKKAKAVKA